MRYPLITGHTGNDETADNSLGSVYKSIELQADAFELDVRRDTMSNLVLTHNEHSQNEYDSCPRLSEVFIILKKHPEIRVNCDLKEDNLPLEVINLAAEHGLGADRLIITGFLTLSFLDMHPEIPQMADIYMNGENILESVYFKSNAGADEGISRQEYYRNPWLHLGRVFTGIELFLELLSDTCKKYGLKGINLPFPVLTDESLRYFRKNGIPVSVWTVNVESEIRRLLAGGVENLTTRRVVSAKSIRKDLFGF